MAKIPARQFAEKLAEKVNVTDETAYNFVLQLSDEGKLKRTKIKNRWHFDDDDLYKASNAWLFSEQFISSLTTKLNALPNNTWEKIRLLLQEISKFDFMPICFAYERERKIPTINKENHDLSKFLLDLIDRLERHLLEGYSDTWLQFRPPYRYQGFCHAFGMLTAHLGGCYTTTHDLNKFCYTQNALAEFINGRFNSKAVDFDIFLRHFGLNVDDFILPINEDKDKFFDDRPPVVPNAPVSVPAPVETSVVTSHEGDTVGKKINLQTHATQATTIINPKGDFSMEKTFTQYLPEEFLTQQRFFPVTIREKDGAKVPMLTGWQKPDNQLTVETAAKKSALLGFDTSGHEQGVDYLFFDFDHVLDDNGDFVNDDARKWFESIHARIGGYCERSVSGHGIHILAKPTAGKFAPVSAGKQGVLYFDEANDVKLEIFYKTAGRYCLLTGNLFDCEAGASIAAGAAVDEVFSEVLAEIQARAKKTAKSAKVDEKPKTAPTPQPARTPKYQRGDSGYSIDDDPAYKEFRIRRMLDAINPSDLEDSDWLAVISACKNESVPYAVVDAFNQRDPNRYNADENQSRWDSVADPSFNIETLHGIAKNFGYDERESQREWFQMHPELSARAKRQKNGTTQDFIRDCPVNLVIPDGFKIGYNGITYLEPSRKENGKPRVVSVACTPIVPIRKIRNPIKGTVEYEFAIRADGEWCKVKVDGATYSDQRELRKLLGAHGALIDSASHLNRYINAFMALNSAELPKAKSFNQTGWVTGDCEDFALPSTDDNFIVSRANYEYERIFKPEGSSEAWLKKLGEVTTQGGAIARVLVGASCAAPLVRPMRLPNLQVHLHGKRSIGKTPMLKFAVSIFGNPNLGDLSFSFGSTSPKSRLELACAFRDLPLVGEEIESLDRKSAEKLPQDIYNYSLGIGGQVLNNDGTIRDAKIFSGTRLTSGEHEIAQKNGNGGELKRALELRAVKLLDEDFASELYGFCERNHGLFGAKWIRYIKENSQKISEHFYTILKSAKTAAKKVDDTQLKTLIISLVAYRHFLFAVGLTEFANYVEVVEDMEEIMKTMACADDLDDAIRAVDFLGDVVAGHQKYFPPLDTKDGEAVAVGFTNEQYGIRIGVGEYAFIPSVLREILENEGGFKSGAKIINELCDKGFLVTNAGRNDHQIRVNGELKKYIHFKKDVLVQSAAISEESYYEQLEA